jgi:hypothetical protein|mmetsp:Transcript_14572/g.26322  ORF Transcript_14572/g.26322 Transcript_14572/m.26322 type:complete len:100 (-) Transcript_14572:171-470(-)
MGHIRRDKESPQNQNTWQGPHAIFSITIGGLITHTKEIAACKRVKIHVDPNKKYYTIEPSSHLDAQSPATTQQKLLTLELTAWRRVIILMKRIPECQRA